MILNPFLRILAELQTPQLKLLHVIYKQLEFHNIQTELTFPQLYPMHEFIENK